MQFHYLQADTSGQVQSGESTGVLTALPDGRLELVEDYGRGTNVLGETDG